MRQIESPPLTDRQTGLTAEVPEVDATVNFGSAPMLEAVESHRATGNQMGNVPAPFHFIFRRAISYPTTTVIGTANAMPFRK